MSNKAKVKEKLSKNGSIKLVPSSSHNISGKGTGRNGGVLKWIKRANKKYAVLGGLLLLAISLPLSAYLISRQNQLLTGQAAGNNRPYFSSVSPKAGAGTTLSLVTTVKDADGINTLSNVYVWLDNRLPVSSRTAAAGKMALSKDANGTTGWRYWGWTYNGNNNTCADKSTAEACWANYSINLGGYAPSDNKSNKIYSGGSYSDSTASGSGRTAEWKVKSVTTPDANTLQVVWEITFYSNFPVENTNIYFHANDNTVGLGANHNATEYWTQEGTGTWNTKTETNHVPVITSKPATRIKVGQLYRYEVVATDADRDKLTYTVSSKPGWLTLSGKVLSGTPEDRYIGKHSVTVVVSDGKTSTKQAYTVNVYGEPIITNEPPAVSVVVPEVTSVFRGAANTISWQASDADGIASISLHYSLDGETWVAIAEGLPGTTVDYVWDVSLIVSGKYYVRVTATDAATSPLSNTATSPAFSVDNNPEGTNKPQIRGVQPGEGDVIENTVPTISASYTSGDVEIDINSVVMKLDNTAVQATVLTSSCHYTPTAELATGAHRVELVVRNVNGDEAQKAWSFTVFGEVEPEGATINTKKVMDLPIIGQVAMPIGIALIVCLILGVVVLLVIVTIKLIKALKKPDEEMEIPQYYADYGNSSGPDFVDPTQTPVIEPGASALPGSDIVEGKGADTKAGLATPLESSPTVPQASSSLQPEVNMNSSPADSLYAPAPERSGVANDPFDKDLPKDYSPESGSSGGDTPGTIL